MLKLIAILLIGMAGISHAFTLNPTKREYLTEPKASSLTSLNPAPVHEILTRQARLAYWEECRSNKNQTAHCQISLKPPRTIEDSLIRGVWWNDDPNQNLYKGKFPWWFGNMHDAHYRARHGATIDDRYKMHYRSHYGDMQFLHSMAAFENESGESTRTKILMWAEFMYHIAIGRIPKSTRFKSIGIKGLENFFGGRHAAWEIHWILQPKYLLRDSPNDLQEHALGSLLHMVQDSYSKAHVSRDFTPTAQCPYGSIKSFNSYTHQSSSKHGIADTWAGYMASAAEAPTGAKPVEVSAHLISLARDGADWKQVVLPYLKSTVYCFDATPEPASAGGFE